MIKYKVHLLNLSGFDYENDTTAKEIDFGPDVKEGDILSNNAASYKVVDVNHDKRRILVQIDDNGY
jgi:hypothetical protein